MNCDELVELVTAYLERALDPRTEQRFVEHLAECDGCGEYVDQFRRTIHELGHLPGQRLAPEAREQLLAAFRNRRTAPPG